MVETSLGKGVDMLGILSKWALYIKTTYEIFENDINEFSIMLGDNKKAKELHRQVVNEAREISKTSIKSFESAYQGLMSEKMREIEKGWLNEIPAAELQRFSRLLDEMKEEKNNRR